MREVQQASYAVRLLAHEIVGVPELGKMVARKGDGLRAREVDIAAVQEVGDGVAVEDGVFLGDEVADVLEVDGGAHFVSVFVGGGSAVVVGEKTWLGDDLKGERSDQSWIPILISKMSACLSPNNTIRLAGLTASEFGG